jgi:hypothetical protein
MKLLDKTPLTRLLNLETRRLEQLLLDGTHTGTDLGMPLVTPRTASSHYGGARKAMFYLLVFDPLNRCHFVAADPMVVALGAQISSHETLGLSSNTNTTNILGELLRDVEQLIVPPVAMVAEFFTHDERMEFDKNHAGLVKNPDELLLADLYASQRFPEKSPDIPANYDPHWQAQCILNVAFFERWLLGSDTHVVKLVQSFGAGDNQSDAVQAYDTAVNDKYIVCSENLSLPGTNLGKLMFYIERMPSSPKTSAATKKSSKKSQSSSIIGALEEAEKMKIQTLIKGEAQRFIAPLRIFHAMRSAKYLEISNNSQSRTEVQVAQAVQCMFGRVPTSVAPETLRSVSLKIRETASASYGSYSVETALDADTSNKAELDAFEQLVVWQLDVASQAQISGVKKTHRQHLHETLEALVRAECVSNQRSKGDHEAHFLILTILLMHLVDSSTEDLSSSFSLQVSTLGGPWRDKWARRFVYFHDGVNDCLRINWKCVDHNCRLFERPIKFTHSGKLKKLAWEKNMEFTGNPSQAFDMRKDNLGQKLVKQLDSIGITLQASGGRFKLSVNGSN